MTNVNDLVDAFDGASETFKRAPMLSDLIKFATFLLQKHGDKPLRYCEDKYSNIYIDADNVWDLVEMLRTSYDNTKYIVG